MAEDKNGFVLYKDLISVVRKLVEKDRENKTNYGGELFLLILEYVNDNDPIPLDFVLELAFEPIKCQLKRDLKKYSEKVNKNSESGRIGNLKRWNPDLYKEYNDGNISLDEAESIASSRKCDNEVAEVADIDTDNVSDSDMVKDIKKEDIASQINFDGLLKAINDLTGRKFKMVNSSVRKKYIARLKEGYTKKDIITAIRNAVKTEFHIQSKFKHLTPEFFSRADIIDKYSDTMEIQKSKTKITMF